MITIPIDLDEETLGKVDALVKKGLYTNRTEALRDQIIKGIEKIELIEDELSQPDLYQKLLKNLLALEHPPNLLSTDKTISELVSEGREQ